MILTHQPVTNRTGIVSAKSRQALQLYQNVAATIQNALQFLAISNAHVIVKKTFRAGIEWVKQFNYGAELACSLVGESLASSSHQESPPIVGACSPEKIQALIQNNPLIWTYKKRLPPKTLSGWFQTKLLQLFGKISETGDYGLIAQRRQIVFSRDKDILDAFNGPLKTWDYSDADWLSFGDQYDLKDPTFEAYGI